MNHTISKVAPDSIGAELELEPGDQLVKIGESKIEDVFDYRYLIHEEYLELTVLKKNGEEWILEVEKDYDEDLGLEFESSLMSDYRSCQNQCMFCFIDQMPPGMRETLYFKDDDSRLSFLQGNYITMTNMKEQDLDRIVQYHLAPINISIHSMDPNLRCKMLNNRFAGKLPEQMKRLKDHDIEMNGQIVLCKGVNDGKELEYSLEQMFLLAPQLQSVSIVPAGLTKFRQDLYPLEPFTSQEAGEVIDLIENYQQQAMKKFGMHFVHASDEWYLLAGRDLPEEERYDGYLQLENGVGMMRLLEIEVTKYLDTQTGDDRQRRLSIATGKLAYPMICSLCEKISGKYPGIQVQVYEIRNDFFGELITVSGLITGQDLARQLAGKDLGERLLLPCNMLRSGEDVFLDDMHLTELETTLQTPVNIVESTGMDFVRAIVEGQADRRRVDEGFNYITWRQ